MSNLQQWRTRVEVSRLSSCREGDWQLPGYNGSPVRSRTCFAGNGRPCLTRKSLHESSSDDSDDLWSTVSSEDSSIDVDDPGSTDEEDDGKSEKPAASRVILEVEALTTTLTDNCWCSKCNSKVEVELKTVCLATSIEITCTNEQCGYIYFGKTPAQVKKKTKEDKRERSTDYAINILYVLSLICCWDGCTEAVRILGFLMSLPNNTTMEGRSFGIIEERIGPQIRSLTQQILVENLADEVKATKCFDDEADFERWKAATTDKSITIHKSKYAKLRVSYDMAWQQRNSGNRYASPSGHALLMGGITRRPVHLVIKSKICNFCNTWKKKNKEDANEQLIPHSTFVQRTMMGHRRQWKPLVVSTW
jgi:hypothetical protein